MSNATNNCETLDSMKARPLSYDALKAVAQNLSIIQKIKMSRKSETIKRLTDKRPPTINQLHYHYNSSEGTTITVDASWQWRSGIMRAHPNQDTLMRGLFQSSMGVKKLTLSGSYPEWLEMPPIPEDCVVEVETLVLPSPGPVSQLLMSEENIRCKEMLVEFDIAQSERLLESEFLQQIPKITFTAEQSVKGIARLENPSLELKNELLDTVEILRCIKAWLEEPRPLGAVLTMRIQHEHFIPYMEKLLVWKFEHLFYDDASRILLNETSILSITMKEDVFKMVVEPIAPSRRAVEMLTDNAPRSIEPYSRIMGRWQSLSDPSETCCMSSYDNLILQMIKKGINGHTVTYSVRVENNVLYRRDSKLKVFVEKGYLVIVNDYDLGAFGESWKVFERVSNRIVT